MRTVLVDTAEWIPGTILVGGSGGGPLGSEIPSTGVNGPGYVYNSLSLPADTNREYSGRLGAIPAGLNIFANEDSSFVAWGADGTYTVPFTLYQDYVDVGTSSFGVALGAAATTISTTPAAAAAAGVAAALRRAVTTAPGAALAAGAIAALDLTIRGLPGAAIAAGVTANSAGPTFDIVTTPGQAAAAGGNAQLRLAIGTVPGRAAAAGVAAAIHADGAVDWPPTPAERTLVIAADDRVFTVSFP